MHVIPVNTMTSNKGIVHWVPSTLSPTFSKIVTIFLKIFMNYVGNGQITSKSNNVIFFFIIQSVIRKRFELLTDRIPANITHNI